MWSSHHTHLALLYFISIAVVTSKCFETSLIEGQYLRSDTPIHVSPKDDGKFVIFCYSGLRKMSLEHMFTTAQMSLSLEPGEFEMFWGEDEDEVASHFQRSLQGWGFLQEWRQFKALKLNDGKSFTLPLNKKTCVGVVSDVDYTVSLNYRNVDVWKLLMFIGGTICFCKADKITADALFYHVAYSTAFFLGSFVIVCLKLSALIQGVSSASIAFCGLVVTFSLIRAAWRRGWHFLSDNFPSVAAYSLCTASIAVAYVRRSAPHENTTIRNSVKWICEVLSLLVILASTNFKTAMLAFDVALWIMKRAVDYSPIERLNSWATSKAQLLMSKLRFRRRRRRLLSDAEYDATGVVETVEGLQQLRTYITSPDVAWWQILAKLENRDRFLEFMRSGEHIMPKERRLHDDWRGDGHLFKLQPDSADKLYLDSNGLDDLEPRLPASQPDLRLTSSMSPFGHRRILSAPSLKSVVYPPVLD